VIAAEVRQGRWADSARLMAAARAAESQSGVARASCFMATPANLDAARQLGLWHEAMQGAGPDDLVLVAEGDDPEAGLAAAARHLEAGAQAAPAGPGAAPPAPRTLASVRADLAVVSVPGEYAALEAHKALEAGMDVLLFSDGVAVEDEVALKRRARALGRLVMGPGAGTAIVSGVGLGFANVVSRGPVGVVAAAGTGAQEVTCLLDRFGSGITDCYGTGGRDLHREVGAISALTAVERLAADPATRVVVCVSKPPDPDVAQTVLAALAATGKPAVACMVGGGIDRAPEGVTLTATLEEAALAAARAGGATGLPSPSVPRVDWVVPGAVRGLFSGGTLCGEAAAILAARLGRVASNAPAGAAVRLAPGEEPRGHAVIDMGEEEYTRGRPHPMIDLEPRIERLAREAADHEVAVILLDVVLGYASHPDPASVLAPAVRDALAARPNLAIVVHVCGTPADPQGLERQEAALAAAGARLCPTNAGAARLAAALVG
jgi:FdrA protein